MCSDKIQFTFKNRWLNPEYLKGLIPIPDRRTFMLENPLFESCQIHNNSENNVIKKLLVKTLPKWPTILQRTLINTETGEIILDGDHETNEIKQSNSRKIKALHKFSKYFQTLYNQRKVTLFFFTFTRMNYARIKFSDMLDSIKYRFKNVLKKPIRGFIWVLEVSSHLHAHYHLCVATDRMIFRKIPNAIKFEILWGQRTEVTIVKKSIRGYLSKYFAKEQFRLCFINEDNQIKGFRSYGISKLN